MKKFFSLLLLALLFACSNDDNSIPEIEPGTIINPAFDTNLMIGAWVNESLIVNGGESIPYEHNPLCAKDAFGFFNEEGRPFTYEELVNLDDNCVANQVIMEWSVIEDQLFLFFGDQLLFAYQVLSISETEFRVINFTDFDGDGNRDSIEVTAVREDPYGWFED